MAGEAGFALLKMGVFLAREGGYISEYDAVIGEKLAHVLSGGRLAANRKCRSNTCSISSAKRS